MGVADFPIETLKALRIHPDSRARAASNVSNQPTDSAQSTQSTVSTATSTSDRRSGETPSHGFDPSTAASSLSDGASISRTTAQGGSPPPSLEHTISQGSEKSPLSSPTNRLSTPVDPSPITSHENNHRTILGSALGDGRRRSGSHSRSQSRASSPSRNRPTSPSSSTQARSRSRGPSFDPAERIETIMNTTKGVQRIIGAGIKSPMDFSMNIARGFHNAPKLYGDQTVRQNEKITDLQSGLKAAGKVN